MRTESLTIHPDLVDMDQEVSHMLAPTCANPPAPLPLRFATWRRRSLACGVWLDAASRSATLSRTNSLLDSPVSRPASTRPALRRRNTYTRDASDLQPTASLSVRQSASSQFPPCGQPLGCFC